MIGAKYYLPALLLAALSTGAATAETLLYELSFSVNRKPNVFQVNQFDLDLVFGDDRFSPSNGVTLFDDLVISPGDVGSTFMADNNSDVAFPVVAGRLTDALDQFINVSLTENNGSGFSEHRIWKENRFFQQDNPPDLAGSTVEMVSLHVDSFTFLTDEDEDEDSDEDGQPVDLELTVSFFGAIPEPTSCVLLGIGLIAVGCRVRSLRR